METKQNRNARELPRIYSGSQFKKKSSTVGDIQAIKSNVAEQPSWNFFLNKETIEKWNYASFLFEFFIHFLGQASRFDGKFQKI